MEAKEQDLTATAEGRAEIEAELFDLRTAHDSLQQAKEQVDRDLAGLRQQLQGVQEALAAAEVGTCGSHPALRAPACLCPMARLSEQSGAWQGSWRCSRACRVGTWQPKRVYSQTGCNVMSGSGRARGAHAGRIGGRGPAEVCTHQFALPLLGNKCMHSVSDMPGGEILAGQGAVAVAVQEGWVAAEACARLQPVFCLPESPEAPGYSCRACGGVTGS